MVVVGSDLRYWRHGDEGPYNLDQKFVMEMLAMLASCLVCFITRMDIYISPLSTSQVICLYNFI